MKDLTQVGIDHPYFGVLKNGKPISNSAEEDKVKVLIAELLAGREVTGVTLQKNGPEIWDWGVEWNDANFTVRFFDSRWIESQRDYVAVYLPKADERRLHDWFIRNLFHLIPKHVGASPGDAKANELPTPVSDSNALFPVPLLADPNEIALVDLTHSGIDSPYFAVLKNGRPFSTAEQSEENAVWKAIRALMAGQDTPEISLIKTGPEPLDWSVKWKGATIELRLYGRSWVESRHSECIIPVSTGEAEKWHHWMIRNFYIITVERRGRSSAMPLAGESSAHQIDAQESQFHPDRTGDISGLPPEFE